MPPDHTEQKIITPPHHIVWSTYAATALAFRTHPLSPHRTNKRRSQRHTTRDKNRVVLQFLLFNPKKNSNCLAQLRKSPSFHAFVSYAELCYSKRKKGKQQWFTYCSRGRLIHFSSYFLIDNDTCINDEPISDCPQGSIPGETFTSSHSVLARLLLLLLLRCIQPADIRLVTGDEETVAGTIGPKHILYV